MNTSTYSYKDIFKEQEKNLGALQNSFIHNAKLDAFDDFYKLGFPTRRNEAWKYTNVSAFTRASLNPLFYPQVHSDIKKSDFRYYDHIKANKLVVVNGSFQKHLSEIHEDPDKVAIMSVSEAITGGDPCFAKHFNSLAQNGTDHFSALNTSMFGDGILIHVRKNVQCQYPIIWFFISKDNSDCIINPRNLIILDKGAQAEIIKDHQGLTEGDYFINAVTEIILSEDSTLDMTSIQNETSHGLHYVSTKEITQKKNSTLNFNTISLSGKLIRNNLRSALQDVDIQCNIRGLYYGKDHDTIDNNFLVEHKAENCMSNQLIKGILKDDSNGIFTGKIFVHKGANKTNAYQKNNNLLLSENATMNSRPQLEIYADDVKCSHGATNGQIDENAKYYLMSRGLTEETSLSFIQYAFVAEVFSFIKNEGIRNYLDEVFRYKLGLGHI
ncbi:MAG: Fe-S cluster assembly protein SufD [Chitinophagales bacterium]|nr:Fe-S cluster assembly protein SufD [Chitinophagales bacterium]